MFKGGFIDYGESVHETSDLVPLPCSPCFRFRPLFKYIYIFHWASLFSFFFFKVTIFGQSAGGASILTHLLAPSSWPMYGNFDFFGVPFLTNFTAPRGCALFSFFLLGPTRGTGTGIVALAVKEREKVLYLQSSLEAC